MPVPALVAAILLASPQAGVQVTTPLTPKSDIERQYGKPEPIELTQLAYNGSSYEKRNVMTRGVLGILVPGRFLSLTEGAAAIMIIVPAGAYEGMARMAGLDVDVTGIARVLPPQDDSPCQGVGPGTCDDPRLPLRPARQPGLPHVSISAYNVVDRGTGMSRGRTGPRELADAGLEAAAADGKPVRALGQFRGANLCRDLPIESRRDPADWVLLTPEGAVWVSGQRPAGRGFQLDPAYRADTARWLEVSGRVLSVGAVRYLKASKVALAARPAESEAVPCPP